MGVPSRILSLNLGMQTLGLAEFKLSPTGGLTLVNFKLTELLADPAAESSRAAQMRVTLREMVAAFRAGRQKVNYAIAAQSVFTRFVKLPPVAPEKIEQIINFEAQQNVPFPIDEVVWDYQLVGGGDTQRIEVVLVAIKSDLLEELNGAVEDAGLVTATVDVAPMALYNAFRYNYSDLKECTLLIDIGARTTNLIFIEPHKVFCRSIPIGGTSVTTAIAKEFSEPFSVSEDRKRHGGFVSLGGTYADPGDPDLARLSRIARNTMTRLHAEISRSISFYRSQQQGSAPQRAFLCGGSTSLPYTREFFQEKLQIPVEYFNPLRNVTVAPGVNVEDASRSAHVMGELVGLGLRAVTSCPMELNLCPASVVAAQKFARQRPYLVAASVCFLLALAVWWLYLARASAVMATVVERLKPTVANLQAVERQFKAVEQERNKAAQTSAPFLAAVHARDFWVRTIDDINKRLPARYIWVTEFKPVWFGADGKATPVGEPTAPGRQEGAKEGKGTFGLQLQGLYLDNPRQAGVVDDFVKALSESPLVAKVEPKERAQPNAADWAYSFQLHVHLKQSLSTP